MTRHNHLGIGFQVWNGQRTWFWSILDSRRNGGSIGAASSEAQAMREARIMIEEQSLLEDRPPAIPPRSSGIIMTENGWAISLNRLERYLGACAAAA